MSIFIKEIVKRKLKQITKDELLVYSKQYGISISEEEANDMIIYIRNNQLDPFNSNHRQRMFADLAEITNKNTAFQAEKLLKEIIRTYGFEHLFN